MRTVIYIIFIALTVLSSAFADGLMLPVEEDYPRDLLRSRPRTKLTRASPATWNGKSTQ